MSSDKGKSKLHLKRTPAEQAQRDLRKALKAARKAAKSHRKRYHDVDEDRPSHAHKRRRETEETEDNEDVYGPPPPPGPSSYEAYEDIRARVEEERFREKMAGAFEDDEHLISVEARLNAYAHVPRRWRSAGAAPSQSHYYDREEPTVDPRFMEDEEYAEWIRTSMHRKKYAAELEEQRRAKAAREAAEAEAARLLREQRELRQQRRRWREQRHEDEAREAYERRWQELLAPSDVSSAAIPASMRFEDVPWPIFRSGEHVSAEQLTAEAISAFLLPAVSVREDEAAGAKRRRDRLRETMLRFHPDKFEGRVLLRIREEDRPAVMEGVGIVARAINVLMGS
ncbi:hypothetical protein EWM64_g7328 [Hericium alpestre]|uniref:NF-kappa-B inhibitor-like protein 1 n=1 Tax=Hericium alpestre TaxID=135208 RepID=A0A4Y9ZR06_9AGAM|nr:hypothetical protein EWM64_g7328 [Hericium alpestre]